MQKPRSLLETEISRVSSADKKGEVRSSPQRTRAEMRKDELTG